MDAERPAEAATRALAGTPERRSVRHVVDDGRREDRVEPVCRQQSLAVGPCVTDLTLSMPTTGIRAGSSALLLCGGVPGPVGEQVEIRAVVPGAVPSGQQQLSCAARACSSGA